MGSNCDKECLYKKVVDYIFSGYTCMADVYYDIAELLNAGFTAEELEQLEFVREDIETVLNREG